MAIHKTIAEHVHIGDNVLFADDSVRVVKNRELAYGPGGVVLAIKFVFDDGSSLAYRPTERMYLQVGVSRG